MCKNSVINFRINSDLKDNAQQLVKKLGYKNLSSFLREYIEELSNLNDKNFSELELLEELYNSKLNDPSLSSFEKFSIKNKINTIKEFKSLLDNEL